MGELSLFENTYRVDFRVDEPNVNGLLGTIASPNQATSYVYDSRDNLIGVTQGSQSFRLEVTDYGLAPVAFSWVSLFLLLTFLEGSGTFSVYLREVSEMLRLSHQTPFSNQMA